MTELKLSRYTDLEFSLNRSLTEFNTLDVNKLAAEYIDLKPLTLLDTATILRQQANDKASKLSNYKEMLSVGVDITTTIPDCQVTKSSLDSIAALFTTYSNHVQFKEALQYIAYSKKASKFVITDKGKTELESRLTRLSGDREKAYVRFYELKDLLDKAGHYTARNVFNSNVIHGFNNNLLEEAFVNIILRDDRK